MKNEVEISLYERKAGALAWLKAWSGVGGGGGGLEIIYHHTLQSQRKFISMKSSILSAHKVYKSVQRITNGQKPDKQMC